MNAREFDALKEFAGLFRSQVENYSPEVQKRLDYLFKDFAVCRQAVLQFVETEGPRKSELDGILRQIHPKQYPA